MLRKILHMLDRKLKFVQLLWLIPIILTTHNAEEALTMPQWVSENRVQISSVLPFPVNFSRNQLLASLASATIIPFCITVFCISGKPESLRIKIVLGLQAIVFMNALVPHIALTVWLMKYNPGFFTAVLFNIPFTFYLFRRAIHEGFVKGKDLAWILVAGLFLYPPAAYLNHVVGEMFVTII